MEQVTPEIGKPYLWKSGIYGDVAVHVVGFSPNGKVAKLSVDGGADSTPARTHLALKDGFGYCVIARGELHKRVRRVARPKAAKAVSPAKGKPAKPADKSPVATNGNDKVTF